MRPAVSKKTARRSWRRSWSRKRKIVLAASIVGVLVLLGALVLGGVYHVRQTDARNTGLVPAGISLEGRNLEGKTRDEVEQVVADVVAERTEHTFFVSLDATDAPEAIAVTAADYVTTDTATLVEHIMDVRKSMTWPERIKHDFFNEPIVKSFETTYALDTAALETLAAIIVETFTAAPTDATLSFEGYTPFITDEQPGRAVDIEPTMTAVITAIEQAISGIAMTDNTVPVVVHTIEPVVTRASLMEPVLTASIGQRRVMLWNGDELVKTYTCAVGRPAYPTIPGEYYIGLKEINPSWTNPDPDGWGSGSPAFVPGPNDYLGVRGLHIFTLGGRNTMMLFHGALAGGAAGTATTHGCLRMFNHDVIDLFDRVPVGTPVRLVP